MLNLLRRPSPAPEISEAEHLRQCIKALADAADSAVRIIHEQNTDSLGRPTSYRIDGACRALAGATDGARQYCIEPSTRAWPERIIGGGL